MAESSNLTEWACTGPGIVSDAFSYPLRKGWSKNPVICVFSGSSSGKSSAHKQSALDLAATFHKNNVTLVNGGRRAGLMREVCRELLRLSGPQAVISIIPVRDGAAKAETDTVSDSNGTTIYVNNLHTRKLLMHRHVMAGGAGSGFVALSGGYGTLDELMECTTWGLRGYHDKGVVMFNVNGFYDHLVAWMEVGIGERFVDKSTRDTVMSADSADKVLKCLARFKSSRKPSVNWKV